MIRLPVLPGMSGTREWVYPRSIDGRFMRLRRWTFAGLHLVLFAVPWITVQGHPLLLIDLPHRRLFLLGQIFTPSDTIFLALLLFFLAFSLFFFTAVFGRVWCGYACPQTVFLESWIRPIEMWIEGDRSVRRHRDAQGMSFDRAWRKAAKWGLFLLVSFLLGMAFTSLFAGARPLWTGRASAASYALVAFFTALWYLDFTWFREQFCIYLCPYARFQSALTDDETLLVSYDEERGEPRHPKRGPEGGCIACQKCVVVCPQGIDIRDGFQLECIQCARCIDACTSVMERFDQPTLVRYSSIAADEGRGGRRARPRTLVYGALLASLLVTGGLLLHSRLPFEATVNRAPGSLFTRDVDGWIRNTYILQITNNDPGPGAARYAVTVEGLPDAETRVQAVEIPAEGTRRVPLIVRLPRDADVARSAPMRVRIESGDDVLLLPTTFLSDGGAGG